MTEICEGLIYKKKKKDFVDCAVYRLMFRLKGGLRCEWHYITPVEAQY